MRRKHRPARPAPETEHYWWAPKRYGIGTGWPIAWQAWAVAASYSLVVIGAVYAILPQSRLAFLAIVLGATAVLLVVCARKTRGGWRWRWGARG